MNKQTVLHLQKLRKIVEKIESISLDIYNYWAKHEEKIVEKSLREKVLIRSNHTMNLTNALVYLWKQAIEKAKSSVGRLAFV